MRSKPVSVVAVVLATVLVAFAAGCGGGSKKSSAPSTQAAAATTTEESATTTEDSATTTEESTTTEKSGSSSKQSFASTKNCRDLAALGAKLSQAIQASAGNGTASLDASANAFEELANAAPSEIRGDFKTFASAFTDYIRLVQKVGFKPGSNKAPTPAQIAQLTKAAQAFESPKLRQAEQHLTAWSQKNCAGIAGTTTGG